MKSHTVFCVLTILLVVATSPALAKALLLHGGHVLEGEVSREKGVYHVRTATGEVRIAVGHVQQIFGSIEDIYRWKRTLIRVGSHSDHIQLAKWCLRYQLLDSAQHELVAAELAEPSTPMVAYLQRRLTALRKAKAHPQPSQEPQRLIPSPTAQPFPTAPVPAGFAQASSPGSSAANKALDDIAKSISPRSMAQFSQAIQPILVNNCATGGCHVGTGPEKMRLYRNGLTGKTRRRLTQRNLHAVMEWITPDRPDYSPLVTVPLRPHGKNQKAPAMIGAHREEYRRLVYWVMQVSREQKARHLAQKSGGGSLVQPTMHSEPIRSKDRPGKSLLQETLDLIPPEGANLQKKRKDGLFEPVYPSNGVTSTTPFRKALAVNPAMLKKFVEEEDKGQKTEDRGQRTEDRGN